MSANKVYRAVGLMSGTSLDGVDVALIETDGQEYIKRLESETSHYTSSERETIRSVFGKKKPDQATILAEKMVTDKHIFVLRNFINLHHLEGTLDVIGFHGQTIFHDPAEGFTWQIGDGAALAKAVGVDVVYNFRQADMKAGGQGAPLLPLYHQSYAANLPKPVAIVNIGGVSNITWLSGEGILAFDCGPGNALLDDFVLKRTGKTFDRDGALGRKGLIHQDIVAGWLKNSYFTAKPPKSLDRDAWDVAPLEYLSDEDGAATLTEFTAKGIYAALKHCPRKPKAFYITGGGRLNKFLMERLADVLAADVHKIEAIGANGDAVEAEGFAWFAVRSLLGLPLSVPDTTGVPAPTTGGVLYKAV